MGLGQVAAKVTGASVAQNVEEFRREMEEVYAAVTTRILAVEKRTRALEGRALPSAVDTGIRLRAWHLLAITCLSASSGAIGAWLATGVLG
jgi:hypothetical protein